VPLDFIDVSDRRLTRAAAELVEREAAEPDTHVTVVLPRRSYSALLGRLLHDRTADKIAAVVSRIPRSAATIVPYDVESRVRVLQERQAAKLAAVDGSADAKVRSGEADVAAAHGAAAGPQAPWPPKNGQRSPEKNGAPQPAEEPVPVPGITPIGALTKPGRATVEGRIRVVEIRPVERNSVLACEISDGTGQLTAMFYGRSHIPGIVCGARVRFRGSVGIKDGHPVMTNPAYELLFPAL
ncbi:MAG: OB-fold nucleic acid binding domain-containing protein, partial [Streptosporangiaceae bacterium]